MTREELKAKRQATVGHLVKERREKRGLTQEKLAQKLPMDRSSFNRLENGSRPVGKAIAARLVKQLGGEPGDYLTDDYHALLDELSPEDRDRLRQVAGARGKIANSETAILQAEAETILNRAARRALEDR